MSWTIVKGAQRVWTGDQDKDGHRTYKVKFRLQTNNPGFDGPALAMQCPGLFVPGAPYLIDNDADPDAYCSKEKSVSIPSEIPEGDPPEFLDIEQTFSTKPDKTCQEDDIENPLLRPPQKAGSTSNHKEEATFDRFGNPITNSAWEVLRGPQVEFDKSRHRIKITQNVANLQLFLCNSMVDTVNAFVLWGMPRRCVKLSDFSWDEKYYGTCFKYYTRNFEFDTNAETFDRLVLDEGTKALNGHWRKADGTYVIDFINGAPPDRFNPSHFKRFVDRAGNPSKVLLNGEGLPADVPIELGTGTTLFNTYISKIDNNLGMSLMNTSAWIRLNSTVAEGWNEFLQYHIGDLTYYDQDPFPDNNGVFLAIGNSLNNVPPFSPGMWLKLPNGAVDAGEYNIATTYDKGDYVTPAISRAIGTKYIEKYFESDFLLLGIPAVL